jgi:hypothetical protein
VLSRHILLQAVVKNAFSDDQIPLEDEDGSLQRIEQVNPPTPKANFVRVFRNERISVYYGLASW